MVPSGMPLTLRRPSPFPILRRYHGPNQTHLTRWPTHPPTRLRACAHRLTPRRGAARAIMAASAVGRWVQSLALTDGMMGEGLLFGDLLRRHRLAAGLTQEELAERAGLSARAISD